MNHTLSLASNVSDPPFPFFTKETIALTIKTIVDGFLDRCVPCFGCLNYYFISFIEYTYLV